MVLSKPVKRKSGTSQKPAKFWRPWEDEPPVKRQWRNLISDFGNLPTPDPIDPPDLQEEYGFATEELTNRW